MQRGACLMVSHAARCMSEGFAGQVSNALFSSTNLEDWRTVVVPGPKPEVLLARCL